MLRRNFFATLLAPLVARFSPKPNPVRQLVEAMREAPPFWTQHEIEYACAVAFGYWEKILKEESEVSQEYVASKWDGKWVRIA